jgi:hypothetical protein
LIRLGMGATSLIRANECRAAPSARARETGRTSASAIGLFHTSEVAASPRRKRTTSGTFGKSIRVLHAVATWQRNVKRNHREPELWACDERAAHAAQSPVRVRAWGPTPDWPSSRAWLLEYVRGRKLRRSHCATCGRSGPPTTSTTACSGVGDNNIRISLAPPLLQVLRFFCKCCASTANYATSPGACGKGTWRV